MLVDRKTGWLHQKHVRPTYIFKELKVNFAVGEALKTRFAQRNSDKLADLLG